eukprot:14080214-Alexandrium_andersonii.AAC.1
MSASLVGSEMCIRDSHKYSAEQSQQSHQPQQPYGMAQAAHCENKHAGCGASVLASACYSVCNSA